MPAPENHFGQPPWSTPEPRRRPWSGRSRKQLIAAGAVAATALTAVSLVLAGSGLGLGHSVESAFTSGKPQNPSQARGPLTAPQQIIGYGSNRCVDATNLANGVAKDGTPLQLWDCSGNANQKWYLMPDGTIRSMGMCMDVAGGSTQDGDMVQLATCNGTAAQQWQLTAAADLVNPQANKCLDAANPGTGNGTLLQIWDCAGSANQKWHTA